MKESVVIREYLVRPAAIGTMLALLPPTVANATESKPNHQIMQLVRRVQTAKTKAAQINASRRLQVLIRNNDSGKVHDKTIRALASLLEVQNDGVRYYVADALGYFGPRARFAVPKLLEILKETDCLRVDISSALAIRPALERIGVAPPPYKCD